MRGATRPVVRMGPMQFRVKGNHQKWYYINLELDTPCECMDSFYHGRPCLHEISARLQIGDPGLIAALGQELLKAQQRADDLERRTKRRTSAA